MDLGDVPTRELRRMLVEIETSSGTVPALRDLLLAEVDRRPDDDGSGPLDEARACLTRDGPHPGYLEACQFRPGDTFGALLTAVAAHNGLGRGKTTRRLAICGLYGIDYGTHGRAFDRLANPRGRFQAHLLARVLRGVPPEKWAETVEQLSPEDDAG